jgi:putative DNA primase/helicase
VTIDDFVKHLERATRSGAGYLARCPAHDDGRPSLSVGTGDKGGIILKCFAGCTNDAIVARLGLSMTDLAPENGARRNGEANVTATYDYHDEKGNVRFQVQRMVPTKKDEKRFRQRRPDGRGGWEYKAPLESDRVLYQLPDLLTAKSEGKAIFYVEGEKDVDNLRAIGLRATTHAGGSQARLFPQYAEALRGAEVIVTPDQDAPGAQLRDRLASLLAGVARAVRVMNVPAPHKDVSDWIQKGGATKADVIALATAAAILQAPALPAPATISEHRSEEEEEQLEFRHDDLGNAQRLVDRHGKNFRARAGTRDLVFMVWDDHRWIDDVTGAVERMAKEVAASLHLEAAARIARGENTDGIAKNAKRLGLEGPLKAMQRLARSEPGVVVRAEDLDAHPWLLNLKNGTLDLRSAELMPHDRSNLLTKVVPVDYDAGAECPLWLAFLQRIMDGNDSLIQYLQMTVGYALTGSTAEQCLFFLYGTGANGKTTFLETLRAIAGDYSTNADFSTFSESMRNDGPRNDIARLAGARVVTAVEAGEGRRLNEPLIKSLTGSDKVTARRLYEEGFEFRPQFKLFLAANHKPVIRGTDEGIWRRVRLIPFTVHIPDEEQDKSLQAKLLGELPGILAWAVQGCQLWLERGGLGSPIEVMLATSEYRQEMDLIGAFLDECCEFGMHLSTPAAELYAGYRRWCERSGERVMSQRAFGLRITERGFSVVKSGKISRTGLKLRTLDLDGPYPGNPAWENRTEKSRNNGPQGPSSENEEAMTFNV